MQEHDGLLPQAQACTHPRCVSHMCGSNLHTCSTQCTLHVPFNKQVGRMLSRKAAALLVDCRF